MFYFSENVLKSDCEPFFKSIAFSFMMEAGIIGLEILQLTCSNVLLLLYLLALTNIGAFKFYESTQNLSMWRG